MSGVKDKHLDELGAEVHKNWMIFYGAKGVRTLPSAITGKNIFVPWEQLDDRDKAPNLALVQSVLKAIEDLGYEIKKK